MFPFVTWSVVDVVMRDEAIRTGALQALVRRADTAVVRSVTTDNGTLALVNVSSRFYFRWVVSQDQRQQDNFGPLHG